MYEGRRIEELERIVKKYTPKYNGHINLETNEKLLRAHYLLACAYLRQRKIEKASTHYIGFRIELNRMESEEENIEKELDYGFNSPIEDKALESERQETELKFWKYLGKQRKLSGRIRPKTKQKRTTINPNYVKM